MGVWSTTSHRFRTRLALAIVSALTGIASLAVLFMQGHGLLLVVLSVISIAAGAGEWGLRRP
jgi:hypothetical protein